MRLIWMQTVAGVDLWHKAGLYDGMEMTSGKTSKKRMQPSIL